MHKRYRLLFVSFLILGLSYHSIADDCLASIGAPDIVTRFPGVADEYLNEEGGAIRLSLMMAA